MEKILYIKKKMPSQEDQGKLTCEHLMLVTFGKISSWEAREAVIETAAELKSRSFQDLISAKTPVAILISACLENSS